MLYHLSTETNLTGYMFPSLPVREEDKWCLTCRIEDVEIPRVCFSKDIGKAFISIYGNLKIDKQKEIELFCYVPENEEGLPIIDTEELTKRRLVGDAHTTDEVWVTQHVKVKLAYRVRFYIEEVERLVYLPYDDPKQKPVYTKRPAYVRWEIVEQF